MHNAMPCAGGDLYDVLELLGEIEWTGGGLVIQRDDDWKCPPVVAWRYKDKSERRDQLIMEAVESFNGSIQWTISFRDRERLPGRNWSIMPQKFKEFLREFKFNPDVFISAERTFSKIEPDVGETANREIPQLAEYIKNFVQAGLSVVQQK
jgi:hypothetical protein